MFSKSSRARIIKVLYIKDHILYNIDPNKLILLSTIETEPSSVVLSSLVNIKFIRKYRGHWRESRELLACIYVTGKWEHIISYLFLLTSSLTEISIGIRNLFFGFSFGSEVILEMKKGKQLLL